MSAGIFLIKRFIDWLIEDLTSILKLKTLRNFYTCQTPRPIGRLPSEFELGDGAAIIHQYFRNVSLTY